MKAVAAEQLFSLALLNEEKDWRLVIDERGAQLTVSWAASCINQREFGAMDWSENARSVDDEVRRRHAERDGNATDGISGT
jgi:hypothetical protein